MEKNIEYRKSLSLFSLFFSFSLSFLLCLAYIECEDGTTGKEGKRQTKIEFWALNTCTRVQLVSDAYTRVQQVPRHVGNSKHTYDNGEHV